MKLDKPDFNNLIEEAVVTANPKVKIIDVTIPKDKIRYYGECIRAMNVGQTFQGKIDYASIEKLESTFTHKGIDYKCTIRNESFQSK